MNSLSSVISTNVVRVSSTRTKRSTRTLTTASTSRDVDSVAFTRRTAFATLAAFAISSASPALAKDGKNGVYFVAPQDKATVPQEFTVKMGVKGYELAPASEGLQEGTGHHHLIIDGGYMEKGEVIPFDDTHVHFGKAQKEGTLKLTPGEHTLTLQFADAKHRSFGKKFAKTITVVVE